MLYLHAAGYIFNLMLKPYCITSFMVMHAYVEIWKERSTYEIIQLL